MAEKKYMRLLYGYIVACLNPQTPPSNSSSTRYNIVVRANDGNVQVLSSFKTVKVDTLLLFSNIMPLHILKLCFELMQFSVDNI